MKTSWVTSSASSGRRKKRRASRKTRFFHRRTRASKAAGSPRAARPMRDASLSSSRAKPPTFSGAGSCRMLKRRHHKAGSAGLRARRRNRPRGPHSRIEWRRIDRRSTLKTRAAGERLQRNGRMRRRRTLAAPGVDRGNGTRPAAREYDSAPTRGEVRMSRSGTCLLLALILLVPAVCAGAAVAAAPATGAAGGAALDVKAATAAYLAKIPPDKKARSDAYFEGGYWLLLWDFLYGGAILLLLLHLGWSAAMRDRAERIAGRLGQGLGWSRTVLYWAQVFVVITLAQLPLAVYEGYFREHKYGLATQTFGPWLADQAKEFAVSLIMYSILLVPLYAVLRRSRNWWIWGSFLAFLF